MLIQSLRLTQFRNFAHVTVGFEPGINWLVGANAAGKTSILEALYYCIAGRSFRSSRSSECIHHKSAFFQIDLLLTKCGLSQKMQIHQEKERRKLLYNQTSYSSFASLFGQIPGVVFTADDLQLIKGAPAQRRLFLDLQLAQADPLYIHHYARFSRAIRQRNATLKMRQRAMLSLWDQEIARAASYIIQKRERLITKLSEFANKALQKIAPTEQSFSLRYKSSYPSHSPEAIIDHLKEQATKDLEKFTSLTGPHRDEFVLLLNDKDARHYSSEGQKISLVASLKLASWHLLKESLGEEPIMIIDDVGSCLDQARTETLLQELSGMTQCFL
jgi:DNA replication and repair protein RecF